MTPETTYYTFEVNGRRTGLFRRILDDEEKTFTHERIDDEGRWIEDPGLVRHFRDSYDRVEIDEAEAAQLAARYGGSL
jgi:hypothetical protein